MNSVSQSGEIVFDIEANSIIAMISMMKTTEKKAAKKT
jgi:hypothetical protein